MKTDQDEIPLFDATGARSIEPLTPAQCRARMEAMRYTDQLIHRVMMMRDTQGLSGEDTYSVLAYYALKNLQLLSDQHLDLLRKMPFMPLTKWP